VPPEPPYLCAVRRSKWKRRVDRTLRVIYTLFAILIAVSGTIDLFRGEWKLAFIEYLIVAILIPAVIVLRNRDRREGQMPVEEPPPRWY
jgi:hypothetical protein